MAPKWRYSVAIVLLLLPPAQTVAWQATPSPTVERPIPDPCERAPSLPFCR